MIRINDGRMKQIRLTNGNILNSHIPVSHLRDFLPSDCFGAPNKKNGAGKPVVLHLHGMDMAIETDVGWDSEFIWRVTATYKAHLNPQWS